MRRLGLRGKIGRATVALPTAGTRTLRIRLSARVRRALLRTGVHVVVRAQAVDHANNHATASLGLRIKR